MKKQIVKLISKSTKQQEGIKVLSAIFSLEENKIGKYCLKKMMMQGGILRDFDFSRRFYSLLVYYFKQPHNHVISLL